LQSPDRDRCTAPQTSSLTYPLPQPHASRQAHQAPMPTSGRSLPLPPAHLSSLIPSSFRSYLNEAQSIASRRSPLFSPKAVSGSLSRRENNAAYPVTPKTRQCGLFVLSPWYSRAANTRGERFQPAIRLTGASALGEAACSSRIDCETEVGTAAPMRTRRFCQRAFALLTKTIVPTLPA
jgi:hypothetical protein